MTTIIILLAISAIGLGLLIAELADSAGRTSGNGWLLGWFIIIAGVVTLLASGLNAITTAG